LEIAQRRCIEARTDFAREAKGATGAVLASRDDESSEAFALALRRGVTDDDELVAQRAFDLDPGLRAARRVRRVAALTDDTLEPATTRFLEEKVALPLHVIAEPERQLFA